MNESFTLRRLSLAVVLCSSLYAHCPALATPPEVTTVIAVKKLCPTCGKKILQKLQQVPTVEAASMNVEQRIIHVQCRAGSFVSPKLLWETVERGGEQPIRLQGPSGTFTAKPMF